MRGGERSGERSGARSDERSRERIVCSDRVEAALAGGEPVLALESTIISHGMPYPRNAATALEACDLARTQGVEPAVVAILEGELRVGLSDDEIDRLGSEADVLKVSRRDIAFASARRLTGATTVSATMLLAHWAGIPVFATGGIGGVHRGAAGQNYDVSADIEEFAVTPVAVVSAGATAILDLPATLELLETKGVPVLGYRTDRFPAFYSRESGLATPLRADSVPEVAGLIARQRALGLPQGILIANPVPEDHEIPAQEMETYIEKALSEMDGIRGKEITPFLLARIVALTGGRALETNIQLFMNNVRLGADIAAELARR